jgi:hypothetical protein
MAGWSAQFTSRRRGVSRPPYDECNLALHVGDDPDAVAANRAGLDIGVPVVWMDQVHGSHIEVVTGPRTDAVPGTDALVTAVRGLGLGVLVADCVPVLLADHSAGVAAAVHVGRRGLVSRVLPNAVDVMVDLGASRGDIHVVIGPSICGRCYEVPAEMQAEVEATVPGSASTTPAGTPSIDIVAGIRSQLSPYDDMQVSEHCTAETPTLFSHRRDGVTGRQAGVIYLTDGD